MLWVEATQGAIPSLYRLSMDSASEFSASYFPAFMFTARGGPQIEGRMGTVPVCRFVPVGQLTIMFLVAIDVEPIVKRCQEIKIGEPGRAGIFSRVLYPNPTCLNLGYSTHTPPSQHLLPQLA